MSKIYAISDDILTPDETILKQAREILECGIKYFQYRSKKAYKNENLARELLSLCNDFKAKFIVNDDVAFAKQIGAKCVHIGKDDGDIKAVREILGKDVFIGVSCYNDINLAIKAQDEGASYVAFGSVFSSPTKPAAIRCSFETILQAKEILAIPICVIGGINAQNIDQILSLEVDLIAVISALYRPESISENYKNLSRFL
ncbi:thiamine phosphate synthase [Campylobacter sp. RM16187]|uniref:thiamine phosphate synthase n=1 Tax=Campylobacter sp. RM16187 TaxID=1660063 RepID=UPI0021B55CAB|nr:thiamine phosphate synthase [Campylobacter sp. RM16187]QKG28914.1 thiamine phosphate synthase [Campylobacter sp. RM16187]